MSAGRGRFQAGGADYVPSCRINVTFNLNFCDGFAGEISKGSRQFVSLRKDAAKLLPEASVNTPLSSSQADTHMAYGIRSRLDHAQDTASDN
jgi:hypothetical protein